MYVVLITISNEKELIGDEILAKGKKNPMMICQDEM
jgi:hypothetical protein